MTKKQLQTVLSILLIIIVAFLIYRYSRPSLSNPENQKEAESGFPVHFQILEEGITTGGLELGVKIIKNEPELSNFWKHINFSRPEVKLPKINFDTDYAVAVISDEKPSGGYYLNLDKVENVGDKINVTLKLSYPGKNCFSAQIITQPFSLFTISKTDLEISPIFTDSPKNCQ